MCSYEQANFTCSNTKFAHTPDISDCWGLPYSLCVSNLIRVMLEFLPVGSLRAGVSRLYTYYSIITNWGYQQLDRCACISRVNRRSTSKNMLCHIFDVLTNIRAHGFFNEDKVKLEENNISLKIRLPKPINVGLPVITLLTCHCEIGSRCHTQHLGMTNGSFNPNSAFSFNVSVVAELS